MFRIGWEPPEIPDFDPEIHNPEKVFAFLCYRGIHYAKWVYIDVVFNKQWKLFNPRETVSYTHLTLPTNREV